MSPGKARTYLRISLSSDPVQGQQSRHSKFKGGRRKEVGGRRGEGGGRKEGENAVKMDGCMEGKIARSLHGKNGLGFPVCKQAPS